jgi:subfamily B ATP-binding cassette protein HlyB/CyaB
MPEGEGAKGSAIRIGDGGSSPGAGPLPPQLLRLAAGPAPQPGQAEEPVPEKPPDTGLLCLTLILRFFHEAADADKLRHDYGKTDGPLDEEDIVRLGRRQKLLARAVSTGWERLEKTPLPAIAPLLDGRFVILARMAEGKVLIQDPLKQGPEILEQAAFVELWGGRLILLAHRERLTAATKGFDFSWFVPALVRYRKLLAEVLAASFFVQLMGLVSPLFFQVVIDKVLVHRGMSSLDVLALGLLVVSVFEVVLAACAPMCWPTRPAGSTSNWGPVCSAI